MSKQIIVIGLGYVGLPLAVELSKYYKTTGFDINTRRVESLKKYVDPNGEVTSADLESSNLVVTSDEKAIKSADVVIVAVPTPVDKHNIPDFAPLVGASRTVGRNMKEGAIVCYESTVYPGATEEECVPVLEKESGMVWKKQFNVAYSPERINPGDKVHVFSTITKVVSGDTPETCNVMADIYGAAVKAGIFKASSIKVAEAAKVIENTQRDINIALMNELKVIFDKIGISTREVLEAAGTKWNFLKFEPGLVGGHCIGVDPYYLAYKAEEIGHHPEIIKAGRRINDSMGKYYATQFIKELISRGKANKDSSILVCGLTFKENVPDIRNTRVLDIVYALEEFGLTVSIWDPVAQPEEVKEEYGITLVESPESNSYDGIIMAVKHDQFLAEGRDGLEKLLVEDGFLYDIKETFGAAKKEVELVRV